MFDYIIVHVYALLVFICVIIFFRVVLGKTERREKDQTEEASGIVGLEVTRLD